MKLKGSCHCQAVTFEVNSKEFHPYQQCFCSICRKTQGGGGFAINLSADAKSLRVKGKKYISVYHARMKKPGDKKAHRSSAERSFCKICSSNLWLYDASYPDLIHPTASAIDTPLPKPPKHTFIMLKFRAPWVELHRKKKDKSYDVYPVESIKEWHEKNMPKK